LATICISYQDAISRSSVAWTAANIVVLCVGHSEACWHLGQNVLSNLDVEKWNTNV